jgi:hypothetical protein
VGIVGDPFGIGIEPKKEKHNRRKQKGIEVYHKGRKDKKARGKDDEPFYLFL